MILRIMTEEDISQVAELERIVFSDPWSEKVYRETLALTTVAYVVAVDDGTEDGQDQIIGAAGVRNISGTGEITNVMVRDDHRGKGIAHAMLEELMDRGRDLGAVDFTLEVRKSNEKAIRLYEKLGFKSAGIRPGFYRNPVEDAVIYWLRGSEETK